MTVPNLPAKYDSEPVVTPQRDAEYAAEQGLEFDSLPESVILCFQESLFDRVRESYNVRTIEGGYSMYDCYRLLDHPAIGVVGGFGIGAPIATLVVEELFEWGVERVLIAGYAGSLQSSIEMGETVIATKGLRDEGVSHHYLPDSEWVSADPDLVRTATDVLKSRGDSVHVGPTWTIDAPYRETRAEVTTYADRGVLTVEMEAAAIFAVAQYRDTEAGALFTISDYLGEEWDPQFHTTDDDLEALFEQAVAVLSAE